MSIYVFSENNKYSSQLVENYSLKDSILCKLKLEDFTWRYTESSTCTQDRECSIYRARLYTMIHGSPIKTPIFLKPIYT